jgi:hypothetical protein
VLCPSFFHLPATYTPCNDNTIPFTDDTHRANVFSYATQASIVLRQLTRAISNGQIGSLAFGDVASHALVTSPQPVRPAHRNADSYMGYAKWAYYLGYGEPWEMHACWVRFEPELHGHPGLNTLPQAVKTEERIASEESRAVDDDPEVTSWLSLPPATAGSPNHPDETPALPEVWEADDDFIPPSFLPNFGQQAAPVAPPMAAPPSRSVSPPAPPPVPGQRPFTPESRKRPTPPSPPRPSQLDDRPPVAEPPAKRPRPDPSAAPPSNPGWNSPDQLIPVPGLPAGAGSQDADSDRRAKEDQDFIASLLVD